MYYSKTALASTNSSSRCFLHLLQVTNSSQFANLYVYREQLKVTDHTCAVMQFKHGAERVKWVLIWVIFHFLSPDRGRAQYEKRLFLYEYFTAVLETPASIFKSRYGAWGSLGGSKINLLFTQSVRSS